MNLKGKVIVIPEMNEKKKIYHLLIDGRYMGRISQNKKS